MKSQIICKLLLVLFIVNCTFAQQKKTTEQSSNPTFLQTLTKGLDWSARIKDQFASDNCIAQCKKIGGFPCGFISKACCLNESQCESSWTAKKCLIPIHAFNALGC